MSKSSIEWTQDTWNPVVGCSILSAGCTNCYAMQMAARIEAMNVGILPGHASAPQYNGTTKKVNGRVIWTGKMAMAGEAIWLQPLKRKKPTTYFVNSMGDLFHEDVPDAWIDKAFAVMALSPQHTFQVLTKRAKRMQAYASQLDNEPVRDTVRRMVAVWPAKVPVPVAGITFPLPNVWLGVSAERQHEADERIPLLLETPAAIRFISAEPLLGPIDLTHLVHDDRERIVDATNGCHAFRDGDGESWEHAGQGPALDWVIVGGESGRDARPMHPAWARSLRVQCESAGVPFFFKQWGSWARWEPKFPKRGVNYFGADGTSSDGPGEGREPMIIVGSKKVAGRSLDGIEYNEMPEARL